MAFSISTRDLSGLGSLAAVERVARSIAVLDAILSPEWDYRFFSFNADWDSSKKERMASMRDGSGDEYFAVFSPAGAILKGFAHDCPMSPWAAPENKIWPGVLDEVPTAFAGFLSEPAFSIADTTFCIWRTADQSAWNCGRIQFPEGEDPDGSENLLRMLDTDPSTYHEFAERYYERSVNLEAVRQIYQHAILTRDLARQLNHELSWDALRKDVLEIGYPMDSSRLRPEHPNE
jgi:hypothetical protein